MISENRQLMEDMTGALISAARVVNDNFGKSMGELGAEYKAVDGDTVRTIIDTKAQEIMHDHLSNRYPGAVFNLEETDVENDTSLEGKLLFFGDPFDGTANAQPRLPLSTQGLMAAQGGEFVAAATLHPFEKYVLFGGKGQGVFRQELEIDSEGNYQRGSEEKALPSLEQTFEKLKSGDLILMPVVDAHYTPINFVANRKAAWKQLFVETFDREWNGEYNARMMREMGSNIDYCMKLAEGRLHVQLTDTIGGIYDVAAGAVFLPELGGVMSDMYGNSLQVPRNVEEMKTPSQQVIVASIHPELHEPIVRITEQCYGEGSRVYVPSAREIVTLPKYTGFKAWDPQNREIFDSLRAS